MNVDGEMIKTARKQKRMTQRNLAKGICTQATISNIENKNTCDSLEIFSAVCLRLDLQVDDCMEISEEKRIKNLLIKVEKLCLKAKHKEAYELLVDVGDDIEFSDSLISDKYIYYKGITTLLGKRDLVSAMFYLYQGTEYSKKYNIYNILCLNGLGVLYELEGQLEKAKKYYDKSLTKLEGSMDEDSLKSCLIYYNTAKFYSDIKNYNKSIELCEKGIDICLKHFSDYLLDFLLYEKAFNEYKLGNREAQTDYYQVYYMTKFWKNSKLLEVIKKDLENII